MTQRQPPEDRNAERRESIVQDVEKGPAAIGEVVESGEHAQRDSLQAVERARADQLGQLPVYLPQSYSSFVLEEKDRSGQAR